MSKTIEIRPYAPAELAKMYNVCKKTLNKWLKPIQPQLGKRTGHFYSIRQVKIIFNHLELPTLREVD